EDAVHATLQEVVLEVEQLERDGNATPDAQVICAEEPDDEGEADVVAGPQPAVVGQAPSVADPAGNDRFAKRTLSAEEAIATLRGKIDRLGPVNMMAIEQFDELETRHRFLTTERKDLIESIAQ